MVAWGNSKAVGMAFGNSKAVGGAWGTSKFAFVRMLEWSGAAIKNRVGVTCPRNDAALPTEWVVGGGAAYLAILTPANGYPVLRASGSVSLHLASTPGATGGSTAGPQLTATTEAGLRIECRHATAGTLVIIGTGSDTQEPYTWTPTNSAQVTAWVNAVSNGDNVTVRMLL